MFGCNLCGSYFGSITARLDHDPVCVARHNWLIRQQLGASHGGPDPDANRIAATLSEQAAALG